MFYYKQIDKQGNLLLLITYNEKHPNIKNELIIEITKDEYERLNDEMLSKLESIIDEQNISDSEALNIITGGSKS